MKDILNYKEFIGSVHFNSDDEIFYGKIEGINDLVTFEGKSVKELLASFKEAVEDYIVLCKSNKKPVYKSYKGSFNVRISPALHRKAFEKALSLGIPLNQLVQKAIENEVSSNK
ncbi:MAG TPA: type II toxin-antitoxin system HicB family antitoxin [Spirochaetota bacterium]|nr:type II toxin-antitoxin system HicB family antitoxin [Spirochaetota bacterium]HQO03558.1 type II toxin-antitoxin system HicB family antitoxin [Spirochaetota bacterium]